MDRSFFMNSSLVVHRVYFIIAGEDRLTRNDSPCYHSLSEFIDPVPSSGPPVVLWQAQFDRLNLLSHSNSPSEVLKTAL